MATGPALRREPHLAPCLRSPRCARGRHALDPGDRVESREGTCTLGFAFDGVGPRAGAVFLGTAAHGVARVGERVDANRPPGLRRGSLPRLPDHTPWDFALILVDPAHHGRVRAAVQGHPAVPAGVASAAALAPGDVLQSSGWGTLFEWTQPTRELRPVVLVRDDPARWQGAALLSWGDRGGPQVHQASGGALGRLRGGCAGLLCTDEGPTVEGLAKAAARGFPLALRTA